MSEHSTSLQDNKIADIVKSNNEICRHELRLRMRRTRNKLSRAQQNLASQNLLQKIIASGLLQNSKSIAFYLPNDGEISTLPIIQYCKRNKIKCYLPRIEKDRGMHFRSFHSYKCLEENKYGILEPRLYCSEISTTKLDLVFTPLVAFDKHLNRIGMGGGYYDRAFAFKRFAKNKRPILIGLAHTLQKTSHIQNEEWDVTLDYLVSDSELLKRPL